MKKGMEKNPLLLALILSVIVGTGAFFSGMKYQESKRVSFNREGMFNGSTGMMGQNGQTPQGQGQNQTNRQGNRGVNGVNGEIIASDEKSITVKLSDGSSKIIFVGTSTSINKATEGTKTDLVTGTKVAVFGSTNTDGSMTAQNIQINPMMRTGTPAVQK